MDAFFFWRNQGRLDLKNEMQYAGGILQATSSKTGGSQNGNKSDRYPLFAERKQLP